MIASLTVALIPLLGSGNKKSITLHSGNLKFYTSIHTVPENHNQETR